MPIQYWEFATYSIAARWIDDGTPMPSVLEIQDQHHGKVVREIRDRLLADVDGKENLERVYIPEKLQRIGVSAFEGCKNLVTVTPNKGSYHSALPPSMLEVGEKAFSDTSLSAGIMMILGKNLTIGDEAFQNSRLSRVVVGSENLKLGKRTFHGCTELEAVLGNPRIAVPEECWAFCGQLKTMSLPISSVADRGFYGCSKLEMLKPVGQKPARIGADAFWGCSKLQIPENWRQKGGKRVRKKLEDTIVLPKLPDCFFETEDDLGDNMTNEEREYEILEAAFGEEPLGPILKLHINSSDPEPLNIPSRLKGRFCRLLKKNFEVSAPAHLATKGVDFLYDDTGNLAPLLRFLADQGSPVSVVGRRKGNYFEVEDIQPLAVSGPLVSKEFFRELIRRARISDFQEDAVEQTPQQYHMNTAEEFEVFLKAIGRSVLPAWAYERAQIELETLKSKHGDEAKHAKLALEFLLGVNWSEPKNLLIPCLEEIQKLFDEQFSGMQELKQVFYELAAQILHTGKLPRENILLVGPAGTGKSAVIHFFAQILKSIPVIRLNFNDSGRDNEAVVSTPRVYSNARLGVIGEGMHTYHTSTQLLHIEELDKGLSTGGLSSDVLLGLLDGHGYKDAFLECQIPTNFLCIATANSLNGLSDALKSRFRIEFVPGYNSDEKLQIWRKNALPKAMQQMEISPGELQITAEAEQILIREYATQSGARDLGELAHKLVSRYCYDTTLDYNAKGKSYTVEDLRALLGPSRVLTRPFDVHPGLVRFAYMVDETPYMNLLEVTVSEGTGKMLFYGLCPKLQQQYCRVARHAVQATTTFELDKYDITVFFPKPIVETTENILGLPMYVAICSVLLKTAISKNSLFYAGAIDLFGNIYLDSPAIATELLRLMEAEGIKTIFGPSGTTSRFDLTNSNNSPIILESASGEAMVRMVMASN